MRIAPIARLEDAVPPKLYSGTERIVSFLTEELVALDHDVTLFASADSKTSAKLVPTWPHALRLDPSVHDSVARVILQLNKVADQAAEFDPLKSMRTNDSVESERPRKRLTAGHG